MNPAQARQLIKDAFTQAFDKARFREFAVNLLNHADENKKVSMVVPAAFAAHIKSCYRLASYADPRGELLDVLVVNLMADYKIDRTRTALRDFVAHKLKRGDNYKEAAFVAFVPPDTGRWRLSYVRMQYETVRDPKTGVIKPEERPTPARRFSYLVGEGESCHTAQTRFLDLLENTATDPTLKDIEEAFSVEAVTKEFFAKYAELFEDINKALEEIVVKDKSLRDEFTGRNVNTVDFVKKLLGQIVFLYFLQKKGWLGVEKGKEWGAGPRDFLRRLVRADYVSYENFFNDVLEPLFYDTLAIDRGHEAFCDRFKCRIPFLNGGLFEPIGDYDWKKTDIMLPNKLFTNSDYIEEGITGTGILDVFDRYNFTVNEAEPLEKEVAIDPEMLGKVFEKLIEENRRKGLGAFYTPREIVYYMCQESLINYLDSALNSVEESVATIRPKQTRLFGESEPEQILLETKVRREIVPRADIETFVRLGEQISHYESVETRYAIKMPKGIDKNARALDDALKAITVCDPAVGSGAFLVGMMTEIVRARTALSPYFNDIAERTPYHFKRHAIQNCLYGVDIDTSAVEIAKLRLWLSLVVDEEDVKQVKPLPNLDYRIVTGNSLLGFPFKSKRIYQIEALKLKFFNETNAEKKKELKKKIDGEIIEAFANSKKSLGYEINFDFEIYFSEVFHIKSGFDVVIANPPYVFGGNKGISREDKNTYKRLYVSGSKKINLFALFAEKGSQILRKRGALIYILPNTLLRVTSYSNTRHFIVENLRVHRIVDLDVGVFDEVTASTIILSVVKEMPERDSVALVQRGYNDPLPTKVLQTEWTQRGCIFDIFSSGRDRVLFDKLENNSIMLEDICSRIRFGIVISGNFDEVVSNQKHSPKWKPFLEGDEIGQFYIKYRGRFIHYEKELLHRSRSPDIFETRKIMIQRITGGETPLKATFDDKGFYNKESILNLILNTGDISYEYVLGLLNSRLANWYYKRRFTNSSKLTVNLSKEYVGQIPVRVPDEIEQKTVAQIVQRILSEKDRNAKADTSALERKIDELMYALYDLTPEEIMIVDGIK